MGRRKGRLEEVLSKALYGDLTDLYTVEYRDGERVVEVGLREFIERSGGFTVIPASRIVRVRRGGEVVYERGSGGSHG